MSTTNMSIVRRSQRDTVIVVPRDDRLNWGDRIALRISIWLIERTLTHSRNHQEMLLERHAAEMVKRRELESLKWLPPR